MKKILIALCGILVINCAHADMSALKVFVGGDFSLTGVQWDTNNEDYKIAKDLGVEDFPFIHNGLGAVLGLRHATRNVYNIGLSLSYDYLLDAKADVRENYYFDKISIGYQMFGLTVDAYIRLFKQNYTENKRGDLVLGVGPVRITERMTMDNDTSSDFDSGFVVKLGYNGQIDQNWDWFLHGRWFALTGGAHDIHSLFNLSLGVKYNF